MRCAAAAYRASPVSVASRRRCAVRRIAGRDGAVIIWFFSYNMSLLVIRRAIPSAADVITKIVVLDRLQSTRRRQPPQVTVRLNQLD